jgi:hypothetical protein
MVQAGEEGGTTYGRKLESIVDWEAVDRSLVEIGADKGRGDDEISVYPPFGGSCMFTLAEKNPNSAASTSLTAFASLHAQNF